MVLDQCIGKVEVRMELDVIGTCVCEVETLSGTVDTNLGLPNNGETEGWRGREGTILECWLWLAGQEYVGEFLEDATIDLGLICAGIKMRRGNSSL